MCSFPLECCNCRLCGVGRAESVQTEGAPCLKFCSFSLQDKHAECMRYMASQTVGKGLTAYHARKVCMVHAIQSTVHAAIDWPRQSARMNALSVSAHPPAD